MSQPERECSTGGVTMSFHGNCAITHAPIKTGDEVVIILLPTAATGEQTIASFVEMGRQHLRDQEEDVSRLSHLFPNYQSEPVTSQSILAWLEKMGWLVVRRGKWNGYGWVEDETQPDHNPFSATKGCVLAWVFDRIVAHYSPDADLLDGLLAVYRFSMECRTPLLVRELDILGLHQYVNQKEIGAHEMHLALQKEAIAHSVTWVDERDY